MSLLTEASLVITPNAVEEGKLFSIIPTDGSGDLTVTRATTATRVNSEGLIEECPYNLLQRSEQISTSPWTLTRSTVTTNNTTSPSGTATADELIANVTGSNGSWTRQVVSAITGAFSMSIYAKQGTSPFLQVRLDGLGAVIFDLSNGTIKASSVVVGSIVSVGSDGWYRCTISGTATGQTTTLFMVGNSSMNLSTWFATNGDSVYLWGAQLVTGTEPKEYFPTTDRLNVPRLDYTNSSCPSILVEPQRTNLVLRSEEFDNLTVWPGSAGVTRLANQGIAPNGTNTMDLITFPISGNSISQSVTVINGTTYTFSVWLASQSGTQTVEIGNINSGIYQSVTVTTTPQRFEVTQVASSTNRFPAIRATAAYSIFAWGAQLEAGSYATSYIPTAGSTVTRNADVISKTGIADLIGQTEGTIYAECNFKNANASAKYISVNNGTNNNRISFVLQGNGTLLILEMAINGTVLANVVLKNLSNLNLFLKIALKYKSGEIKCFVDGQLLFSNNLTYSNAILDRLLLTNPTGGQRFDGNINSIQLYKTALTDEQCISLTTL
jgi:hypothetical protein